MAECLRSVGNYALLVDRIPPDQRRSSPRPCDAWLLVDLLTVTVGGGSSRSVLDMRDGTPRRFWLVPRTRHCPTMVLTLVQPSRRTYRARRRPGVGVIL